MLTIANHLLSLGVCNKIGINDKRKTKSTEKLATGFKINRSADDAAGLSISEKMRNQIRGLNQGSKNVQDGISLIKTADGSLSQISSMLQRINELSVQAYNDTYTKDDREAMQDEVDELMAEIRDEIEHSEFNGIKLLQGDLLKTMIFTDESQGYYTQNRIAKAPDWLSVSTSLLEPKSQNKFNQSILNGLTQDTDLYIYQLEPGADKGTYYGPAPDPNDPTVKTKIITINGRDIEFTQKGELSDTLDDNPVAVIDFGNLAKAKDAEELLDDLTKLCGTSIGFPCGTCEDVYYGIGFTGTVKGYTSVPLGNFNTEMKEQVYGCVNINLDNDKKYTNAAGESVGCFEKIEELIKNNASQQEVQALGKEIAENIREMAFQALDSDTASESHFDRVLRANDTALVIYDYRDINYVPSEKNHAMVSKYATATDYIPQSFLSGHEVKKLEGVMIQCSGDYRDDVEVHLPKGETILSIMNEKRPYSIGRYSTVQVPSKEYNEKLKEYKESPAYKTYEQQMEAYYNTPEYIQYKKDLEKYEEEQNQYKKEYNEWSSNPDNFKLVEKSYTEMVKYISPAHEEFIGFDATGEMQYQSVPEQEKEKEVIRYVMEKEAIVQPPEAPKTKKPEPPTAQKPVPPTPPAITYEDAYVYDPDDNRLINDALKYVNSCRSQLGAAQNRLEYTYNNNMNYAENLTDAESRIRDTDMAEEMVNYSKQNILGQVSQAMMTQANQQAQSVLKLLQG